MGIRVGFLLLLDAVAVVLVVVGIVVVVCVSNDSCTANVEFPKGQIIIHLFNCQSLSH